MALVERKSLENISFKSSSGTETNYKKLYHEAVDRCATLQSQVDSYSRLITKMGKIEQLKGLLLSSLSERQVKMERESQEMSREKAEWEERLHKASERQREAVEMCVDLRSTCDQYRTEHAQSIRLCGHLLTQVAMAKAQSKIQEGMLKEKMSHKSVEVRKLKKIVANYTHLLQRSRAENQESAEFSEAERMMLTETNTELEAKVSNLSEELIEARQQLEETRGELKETEEKLALLQKELEREKERASAAAADPMCSGCGQLKQDLDTTLQVLNDQNCAKYGDLLRSNFSLTQKLKAKEEQLARGIVEYDRLTSYTQDYKMKSKQKVDVLKENLRKADDEISELDSIIEQVRSVMHREIGVVKHSPALLELIRELDGVEAPPTY